MDEDRYLDNENYPERENDLNRIGSFAHLAENITNGNFTYVVEKHLMKMKRSRIMKLCAYLIDSDKQYVQDIESLSNMLDNRNR